MRGDSYRLVGFALGRTALFALILAVIVGLIVWVVSSVLGIMGSQFIGGEASPLLSDGAIMFGIFSGVFSFFFVAISIMLLALFYNLLAELGLGLKFNLEDEQPAVSKPAGL